MKTIHPAALVKGLLSAIILSLALTSTVVAQTSGSNSIPVVTVQATQPNAAVTDSGVFTIFRAGNTNATLNVWYDLAGTASNGVDYAMIPPHLVSLPSGATSTNIVIAPLTNPSPSSVVQTVVLQLTNSPLMTPVNYEIGSPSRATIFITPPGISNHPPVVRLVNPTNGAVFSAPASISLLAKASDPDGSVTNMEFFAGTTDLGTGVPVVLDPPGVNGLTGLVYFLNWQNIPTNSYSLTAVARDNGGLVTTSAPVNIVVLAGPPITNQPPVVRITSPPNGAVFRAPVKIPIYAFAADPNGTVATVEFFADGNTLGFGQPVIAVPPPLPAGSVQPPILVVVATNYWELVWTNAPFGTNLTLTAQATDNGGASSVSAPVLISILPSPPPPTNRPPIVSIVANNPVAIEGTNCWTWRGLASPVTATWSNWLAPNATYQLFTNCGPKNATFTVFRFGATNDSLDVAYNIGGTATNGIDYIALPGLVTVPAGDRRVDISIVPLDDGPPDLTSTVVLKLVAGTNYVLGYPRAAAAIILDSQSPRPVTGITPGAAFNLTATGPDSAWFHVESSPDMINWTALCTNQVVNGTIDFVDPNAATNPALFYRTVPEIGPPTQ